MSRSEHHHDEPLWILAPDLILPSPAVLAVVNLERAGHTLTLDGSGTRILIDPAPGVVLDAHDVAELKRWKLHAILFMRYQPQAVH